MLNLWCATEWGKAGKYSSLISLLAPAVALRQTPAQKLLRWCRPRDARGTRLAPLKTKPEFLPIFNGGLYMHICFQGKTPTGTTFPGTDSRRTLSMVRRRLRPLLYLGLYLFLLVYRCWAPRRFWFSASYISVYRMPRKYFCCAFVPEGLFAVLGNFRIIHTVVAWNWSNQVLLFLLNQSVKKAEFISWTGNPDKTGLGKNFYCSKDLVFRHYRLE